tara:strand:+ start:142 stop:627 length:486 start_codon:yes stop_codon:yes gene_type:complete
MVLVDYIFIFITLTISLMGMLRGFVSQLFSLLSWSLFVYILFYHLEYFTDIVSSQISLDYNYIRIITVSLLTIFTVAFIFILNLTISKLIAATFFQNSNKIAGFLMSLIKSQIYIFVFVLVLFDTSFHESIFEDSLLVPYYAEFIEYISNYEDSLFNSLQI